MIKRIFQMKAAGMSYGAIARCLTSEGAASPSLYQTVQTIQVSAMTANEYPWNVPSIKKILTNRIYLGHMVQGGRSSAASETTVLNTHEAIIDAFVSESAQSVIKEKRSVYFERHGKYDYFEETENILKDCVYCGECGGRLTRRKEVYAQGGKMQYVYVCAEHEIYGNEACSNKTRIHENDLLENVFKQLQAYIRVTISGKFFMTNRNNRYNLLVIGI